MTASRVMYLALGVFVAAWTMIGIPAHATYGARVTADEPQYLLTAISIGEDGDLDISDELAAERYRSFHRVDVDPQTYPLDGRGRQVSPHDPLLPVLLAVPMWAGGWVAAKAALAVMAGALAVVTAWIAAHRFAVRRDTAVMVSAAFACTAPMATYATQVYPEIPAALAVAIAVAASTGRFGRGSQAVFLCAVVALPWLSIKYTLVALAVFIVGCWRLRARRAHLFGVVGVMVVAGVAYLVAHRLLYGGWTAYATGDHFSQTGEFTVIGSQPNYLGRSRRLIGLLVDHGFGIAAWMIGWLTLPYALGFIARRRPTNWLALVVPLGAGWFTATFVALTMHGWWWPGRQLVVVLPLGTIAIAIAVDAATPRLRAMVAGAAALGLLTWLWTTTEAVTRTHTLVVDFERTANPWYRWWRLLLPDGRTATLSDDILTASWMAVVAGLAVLGWRAAQPVLVRANLHD